MSNNLDPDQARRFVGPDMGLNHLQRLSMDETGRERVSRHIKLRKAVKKTENI